MPAASLKALNEHSCSREARAICENFIPLGSGEIFTGHRVLGGGHREALRGKSDSLILELGKSSSEKGRVAQHINSRTGTTHSEIGEMSKARLLKNGPVVMAKSPPGTRHSQNLSRSKLWGSVWFGGQDATTPWTCITSGTVATLSGILFTALTYAILILQMRKLRLGDFWDLLGHTAIKQGVDHRSVRFQNPIHQPPCCPVPQRSQTVSMGKGTGQRNGLRVGGVASLLHCPPGSRGRRVLHGQVLQRPIYKHQYLLDIN